MLNVIILGMVLVSGCFMLTNGLVMLYREQRTLANSLALLVGVWLVTTCVTTIIGSYFKAALLMALSQSAIGLCLVFIISFSLFCFIVLRQQSLGDNEKIDYIIVLGSGLIDNQVPPLLKSRLNQGMKIYQEQQLLGRTSKLVVTGGQGIDEKLAEAEGMKNYLLLAGIPTEQILVENQAVNTQENLSFSKQLIEAESLNYQAVIVSNNFHVLRALLFAKTVGLKAKGSGSQTAHYYLPSALLREYVACIVMVSKNLKAVKLKPSVKVQEN